MLVTKRQYRGAEISAYNLSKELLDKGHKVIWVGLYANNLENTVVLDGAINIDLPDSNFWLSYKKVKAIISLYSKYKPDVCQANGSDTLRYLIAVKLLGFTPKIVYRNISIISKWIDTQLKYFLFKFLFSKTDKVISVGDEALDDFRHLFRFNEEKSMVIRRGVPNINPSDVEIDKIRKKYLISESDFVFIHIGHFSAEKNHKFLINVWEKLQLKSPIIKLILLGDGPLRESIGAYIEDKKLSSNILLPGLQTDSYNWLALSKIMVLCSTIEGVPGVVVEASFQGVPTVAVAVGGVKEVLIDNQNGLLVSSHDENLFVSACEKLIADTDFRKLLASNAKKVVQKRFNLEVNTDHFINTYYSILEKQLH